MKEPKDYQLARRAYEAFFDESPQVWFENLGHEYQMKWVRVARAVVEENKRFAKTSSATSSRFEFESQPESRLEEARLIIERAPKTASGKRIAFKELTEEETQKVKAAQQYVYKWNK